MANEGARFQPTRATRFIFEYDGDQLRLVTQQSVEIVVPVISPTADAPGYYLDARDAAERTLARAEAHGAFTRSTEVFPEHLDEPIARIDVPQQRGAFIVTLPTVEAADHVTVVRIAEAQPGAGADRREPHIVDLASFPLSRP